jgi:hypothetical protein
MSEQARGDSLALFMAMEEGSLDRLNARVTPGMIRETQAELDAMKKKGEMVQFRNLCARKVEISMARPANGSDVANFVARVSMHAQRSVLRGGAIALQDPDVTGFDIQLTYSANGDHFLLDHCAKREWA